MANRSYYITEHFTEEEVNNLQIGQLLEIVENNCLYSIKKHIHKGIELLSYFSGIIGGSGCTFTIFTGTYTKLKENKNFFAKDYHDVVYKGDVIEDNNNYYFEWKDIYTNHLKYYTEAHKNDYIKCLNRIRKLRKRKLERII